MKEKLEEKKIDNINYITSFIFKIRNMPAALYKALGGFASNKVNMLKLESYMMKVSLLLLNSLLILKDIQMTKM